MDDVGATPDLAASRRAGSTRGFLFADLRGYSQYVETHGASAAAQLLGRYRRVVRDAVGAFQGTEIQTEGDSFFVVFDSVSGAVRCGLAIANGALQASTPSSPIRVGIGIHAGETVETSDSYIGSGVNIAARICAQARPGEVLVSETVRALTRNVLEVGFEPRGRPQLKGIAERIPVYAVTAVPEAASKSAVRRRRLLALGGLALGVIAVLGIGVAWVMSQRAAGLPAGEWKIGLITTLTGTEEGDDFFVHVRNAVSLAVEELNAAGGIHGRPLSLVTLDDQLDEFLPRDHAQALVNDPAVLAMIGPYASGQAIHALPISSSAGMLHCSPTNTDPALTKPRYGALDLRGPDPERLSFIRMPPADDIQSKALATFAYRDLNARHVLVIDEGNIGGQLAELFAEEFEEDFGGSVTTRTLNEGADASALLEPLLSAPDPPDAVFFSGATWGGAPEIRQAMVTLGHGETPMLAWDAILDASGEDAESYIGQVGAEQAEGTYVSHAALPDAKFEFASTYRERFGLEPEEWASAAHACMEVIVEGLEATAFQDMTPAQLREQLRAYAVDSERRYETVIGNIGFDQNGDNERQFVGIYRVDPSAAGGLGDWALVKKQDYGPAP